MWYHSKMAKHKTEALQTTTVRVPKRLYAAATKIVREEELGSFNELVVESLTEQVRLRREAQIDAAFSAMKNDKKYQKESARIARDFQYSDRDSLRGTK
jgi:hypothetical protein